MSARGTVLVESKFLFATPICSIRTYQLTTSLSYAETRLILARLFYYFDLELADPDQDWFGAQKAYLVWDAPALNMYLKPVVR